jgi:hypothetical protein
LTEAECYARIYGGRGGEGVPFVRVVRRGEKGESSGERIRRLFEERLDAHGPDAEAA